MPPTYLTISQRRRRNTYFIIGIVGVGALIALAYAMGWLFVLLPFNSEGYLHNTPPGLFTKLDWKVLQRGQWDEGQDPIVPEALKPLAGKPVTLRGYLLPLHPGKAPEFFLAPKPRGCYFCFPPGIAEVVKINMKAKQNLDITSLPVEAYGIFRVAADPGTRETLYALDDAQLVVRHW